jgi:glycosyltransferase involved in cell wall biosynthesis
MEYIKVLARRFKNGERIITPSYLWKGHNASIKAILKRSALLLPNSESEWRRFKGDFSMAGSYRIIPNAIDPEAFREPEGVKKEENMVLCAARIDGHKNQLRLIRALNHTRFTLVIAGDSAPNHADYLEECRKQAGPNIRFTGRVSAEELTRLFYKAKVHALPSWFETTGLSCLEAAWCGCNVVMGQNGDQHDYFGNYAWYCDPGSEESIRENIEKAASAPFNEAFRDEIAREYTWEQTAEKTLSAYREVLA